MSMSINNWVRDWIHCHWDDVMNLFAEITLIQEDLLGKVTQLITQGY
jgi:hypothetical protein